MPAEPATLPLVSSREASPPIGAFQMQFKQLGEDEASAIEDRNVRLTALLDAYELRAYEHIFAAAGYRWVTDFPQQETDLISECRQLFDQMRKPEWKRLVRVIMDQQRTLLLPGEPKMPPVASVKLEPHVCVGCDADLLGQPHVCCGSGLRHNDKPCVNGLHSTCCQKGSIDTSEAWICSTCVVQLVTTGLRIPIGNVRNVYCIRAVDEQVELPDDGAEVQSAKSVVLHELGNEALLRTAQRRYPGWMALSYKDVVHVAAASKFLRRAIMGQSATTEGSLNPFTHLLPQAMLQSVSPGVSPKMVVESIGGWDSGGLYSYAPKDRQEVFTVMATVAPEVLVSFTDKGTLSICARNQGEPISRKINFISGVR